MSENRDEKLRKLREEVNLLKEQLVRISEELEEPEEDDKIVEQDLPVSIEIEDDEDQEEDLEEDLEDEPKTQEDYEPYRRTRSQRYMKTDFMDELGDYIEDFVEDVMEGVTTGLEESLFLHRRPRRMPYRKVRTVDKLAEEDAKLTADAMSALANEHRIKILDELSYGGLYASDFQERLPEISPSTLSSHLDVLEKAGFIVQERRRGRYVISMAGRLAVKMAFQLKKLARDAMNRFDESSY
jgi:DNA-binding transcriptional ArsR family regulator